MRDLAKEMLEALVDLVLDCKGGAFLMLSSTLPFLPC